MTITLLPYTSPSCWLRLSLQLLLMLQLLYCSGCSGSFCPISLCSRPLDPLDILRILLVIHGGNTSAVHEGQIALHAHNQAQLQ